MKIMQNKCQVNVFDTLIGVMRFIVFTVVVLIQVPILFLIPRGRFSVRYMRFFMWLLSVISNVRIRTHGKLSTARPLMCICNHISVFELMSIPVGYGCSFVGKIDIASYPLVGWIAKKFGVVFVDRRPSRANDALAAVSKQMHSASYPVVIFPEGTTTNGAYVKQFKSSLFNIAEEMPDLTIQPLVITYRSRGGKCINDQVLANDFAYFDNKKQDAGPMCAVERSAFGQVLHVMKLGGMVVNITALEPVSTKGMDRKEIANMLHEIVSNKYMELKDKQEITK